jgi:tetratricopeptide (TPR) repeat protein
MKNEKLKIKNKVSPSATYYKYFSLLLIMSLLIVNWLSPAQAWRITKELKQEVASKEAAVAKSPKDAHAHFDLAITYAYTNHIQEGWDELKKVEELDPKFRKKGLDRYVKKVTKSPSDWRLRFRLAFAYYFNSDKKDAIRELKNVLVIDPYNVWAYGYIALIYGEMGEVDTAMEYTKKGLKIDNLVAALHLLLSEGYYKKGDSWRGFLERMEAVRLKVLGY